MVKPGFTGVYIIFLISAQNINCRRGGSNEYHNQYFEQKYEKYRSFLSENFQFLEVKFSIYMNRRVFVMTFLLLCTLPRALFIRSLNKMCIKLSVRSRILKKGNSNQAFTVLYPMRIYKNKIK